MFDATNPEDVQAMLLHMAAASAGAPTGRPRLAKLLRAALALVEDDEPQPERVGAITPAVASALEGIHGALAMMADHAELLSERAQEAVMRTPPR